MGFAFLLLLVLVFLPSFSSRAIGTASFALQVRTALSALRLLAGPRALSGEGAAPGTLSALAALEAETRVQPRWVQGPGRRSELQLEVQQAALELCRRGGGAAELRWEVCAWPLSIDIVLCGVAGGKRCSQCQTCEWNAVLLRRQLARNKCGNTVELYRGRKRGARFSSFESDDEHFYDATSDSEGESVQPPRKPLPPGILKKGTTGGGKGSKGAFVRGLSRQALEAAKDNDELKRGPAAGSGAQPTAAAPGPAPPGSNGAPGARAEGGRIRKEALKAEAGRLSGAKFKAAELRGASGDSGAIYDANVTSMTDKAWQLISQQGYAIAVIVLHASPRIGISGRNRVRLCRLGGILSSTHMPRECIGDYNTRPEAVAKPKFLEQVGGDVVGTCATKYGDDSILDYVVMSSSAVSFAKQVVPIRDVTRWPQIGLANALRASGQQTQTREPEFPGRLPQTLKPRLDHAAGSKSGATRTKLIAARHPAHERRIGFSEKQFGDCLQVHLGPRDPAGQLRQREPEEDLDPKFLFHSECEVDPRANVFNFCSDVQLPRTLEPLEEPLGKAPLELQQVRRAPGSDTGTRSVGRPPNGNASINPGKELPRDQWISTLKCPLTAATPVLESFVESAKKQQAHAQRSAATREEAHWDPAPAISAEQVYRSAGDPIAKVGLGVDTMGTAEIQNCHMERVVQALAHISTAVRFWLRGPAPLRGLEAPMQSHDDQWELGGTNELVQDVFGNGTAAVSIETFGDASGGIASAMTRLRRVCVVIVYTDTIRPELFISGAVFGLFLGDRQGAPRGTDTDRCQKLGIILLEREYCEIVVFRTSSRLGPVETFDGNDIRTLVIGNALADEFAGLPRRGPSQMRRYAR
ncbi:unnamed protein product [Prorocentrum cordatum]|uniref:Uncharacterized protein n=1 Tax=Prorocentrum cordatum TaxID=2364126 RepID=A0ABN9QFE3_9DINO|nr:unnamed protein product [Polarella glacialis]